MNIKRLLVCLLFCFFISMKSVATPIDEKFMRPFYAGVTFGYGATTWGYLISPDDNAAMNLSTPTHVNENGLIWGFFAGYELIPTFAIEVAYEHYPRARVFFDEASLFTFDNAGLDSFVTDTDNISLMGKFMLIIPKNTKMRLYSSVGIAGVHREDMITDEWRMSPKFGVGLDYAMTKHMMIEIGVDYTAGNGVSELNPANSFIPFLYATYLRYALRL